MDAIRRLLLAALIALRAACQRSSGRDADNVAQTGHTGGVAVSDADKEKMASIARDSAQAETTEEPSEDRRREIIAWANTGRARAGTPLLVEGEEAEPPEEEFYRRARALGMVGAHRRDP